MSVVPPIQRKRKARDLANAVTLRPRDVFELYGIPSSTLHDLCTNADAEKRLPSSLIPGRKGKKGLRLIERVDLDAYLAKHKSGGRPHA